MLAWQRDFLQRLLRHDLERQDIDAALQVKERNLPCRLYKYRSFGNPGHIAALKSDKLFASRPRLFNDPFDSAVFVRVDLLAPPKHSDPEDSELGRRIAGYEQDPKFLELLSAVETGNPDPDLEPRMPEALRAAIDGRQQRLTGEIYGGTRDLCEVVSFSSLKTSFLMWSHYGEEHRGFSIEYDLEELDANHFLRRMTSPVIYSRKVRNLWRYLLGENHRNILWFIYAAMIKLHHWSYEKEWRLILPVENQSSRLRSIKMPKPKKLIAGAAVSKEDYAELASIAKEIGAEIEELELDFESGTLVAESE